MRDPFQNAMRRLCIVLGDQHCPLYLWKMFKIFAENKGVGQDQMRRLIDPGYVIKKNPIRGAEHGPSERQRLHCKAKEMLQKKLWHKDDTYRNSLSLWHMDRGAKNSNMTRLPWKTTHTSQQNLKEFKIQKNWILRLNQNGAQQPLNQRPDFSSAKRECKRMHDEHVKRTQQ